MNGKISLALALAMADALSDALGVLDPAAVFVQTLVGELVVTPPVVEADLVIPLAADYPAIAVGAWTAPYIIDSTRVAIRGNALEVRPLSAAKSLVLYGWALMDAVAAGNVLAWEMYASPIPLPDENYARTIVPVLTLDLTGRWDATEIVGDAA